MLAFKMYTWCVVRLELWLGLAIAAASHGCSYTRRLCFQTVTVEHRITSHCVSASAVAVVAGTTAAFPAR